MGAEVEVDHTMLARHTGGLSDAHTRTEAAVRAYLAEMASYGRPWGMNNEVGQAIDMCYSAVNEAYTQCQDDNLDDLAIYPENLYKMASTYRSADEPGLA